MTVVVSIDGAPQTFVNVKHVEFYEGQTGLQILQILHNEGAYRAAYNPGVWISFSVISK